MNKQEYIQKQRDFLAQKANEPGVKALDRGILYKVLASGKPGAPSPNRNSVVTVHYTGCTINGKKFDSSLGGTAPAMRLRDLIQGWQIALPHMHVGDKWELYLPAEMAYGRFAQPGIPANSALIFTIHLLALN